MNQAVDVRHDVAATLSQLNAATADKRQELTYKYLYLDRQEAIFYLLNKTIGFSQSFRLLFPHSNMIFIHFYTVVSLV